MHVRLDLCGGQRCGLVRSDLRNGPQLRVIRHSIPISIHHSGVIIPILIILYPLVSLVSIIIIDIRKLGHISVHSIILELVTVLVTVARSTVALILGGLLVLVTVTRVTVLILIVGLGSRVTVVTLVLILGTVLVLSSRVTVDNLSILVILPSLSGLGSLILVTVGSRVTVATLILGTVLVLTSRVTVDGLLPGNHSSKILGPLVLVVGLGGSLGLIVLILIIDLLTSRGALVLVVDLSAGGTVARVTVASLGPLVLGCRVPVDLSSLVLVLGTVLVLGSLVLDSRVTVDSLILVTVLRLTSYRTCIPWNTVPLIDNILHLTRLRLIQLILPREIENPIIQVSRIAALPSIDQFEGIVCILILHSTNNYRDIWTPGAQTVNTPR